MVQQIVDMPAHPFLPPAVAPDTRLDIAPGAAGIDVVPRGKAMETQRADPDLHGLTKMDMQLIGAGRRHGQTSLPSCKVSTRSIRCASCMSCVTTTKLVPSSRFSSTINS